ncbi:unnamed protein product [Closterium sp. NIES-54]
MADGSWGLPNSTGDAGLVKSSFALVPRGAEPFPKTYTGYNRANKRSRKVEGVPALPATIYEDDEHNKQAENSPAMAEIEVQNDGVADANPAAPVNPIAIDTSFTIPEPFKVFKEAQADLSFLLKACKPMRGQNLPQSARMAIRSLSLNSSIVIKLADKNIGITVMDRQHYVALCMEHLNDVAVYRPVRHDPSPLVLQ